MVLCCLSIYVREIFISSDNVTRLCAVGRDIMHQQRETMVVYESTGKRCIGIDNMVTALLMNMSLIIVRGVIGLT